MSLTTYQGDKAGSRGRRAAMAGAVMAGAAALVLATQAAYAEPVKLRFITTNTFSLGYEPLLKAFHDSHPDIRVEISYVPNTQIAQAVGTQIQGGNPPDIIPASPGSGSNALSVHALAGAGRLVDLSSEPFAKSIPALLKPLVTVNGKIYSFPVGLTTNYFGYTVPVFEKLKIAPPTTWEDLLAACKTLRANGSYAMADGLADSTSNLLKVQSFAASDVYSENPNWDADRAAGKVTFAGTPGWHDVFQQVDDMIRADCFYPGAAGRKWEGALQLLAQEKAQMGVHPALSWIQLHKATPKRVIGTAIVPGKRAAALPLSSGIALSVAKDSKHIPQALEFLAYVSQHLAEFSRNTGAISPADMAAGRLPAFLAPLEPLAKQGKFSIAAGVLWPSAAVAQAAGNGITGLATGQATIVQILADMDAAWDAARR